MTYLLYTLGMVLPFCFIMMNAKPSRNGQVITNQIFALIFLGSLITMIFDLFGVF